MRKEVQIAILTIITLALIVWGYKFIRGTNILKNNPQFYTVFHNVKDLTISSPVMVDGYEIGSVTSIELDPDNINNKVVWFELKDDFRVPKTANALLTTTSVIGGRHIELDFDKMCSGDDCLPFGSKINSEELGMIGSMLNPNELDPYMDKFGGTVDVMLDKLGEEGSEAPVNQAIQGLNASLKNLEGITNNINKILKTSSSDLSQTIENMNYISGTLKNSNTKIDGILDNFAVMSNDMKNLSLTNTLSKTNTTIDQANLTLKEMQTTVSKSSEAIHKLSLVIDKVDSPNGSLGQLMNSRDLYDNLESTSQNLDLLLQDFRLNPKRYVNVSVFGKKAKTYTLPENDPAEKK